MNRKEFLINIWNKAFKPILLFVAAALCLHFLYRAFFESGNERNILVLLTALAFFYMLMYVLGRLFQNALASLFLKIPGPQRTLVRRVLQIISPFVFLYLIYISWQKDHMLTLIVLPILLVKNLAGRWKH